MGVVASVGVERFGYRRKGKQERVQGTNPFYLLQSAVDVFSHALMRAPLTLSRVGLITVVLLPHCNTTSVASRN